MNAPSYGLTKKLPFVDFDQVVLRVKDALATEGFGVLTTIDMKDVMAKKLGVELKRYTILGACNPTLAFKALELEPYIGLLLPCNVAIIEGEDGSTTVSIAKPVEMFKIIENHALRFMAGKIESKLAQVLDRV